MGRYGLSLNALRKEGRVEGTKLIQMFCRKHYAATSGEDISKIVVRTPVTYSAIASCATSVRVRTAHGKPGKSQNFMISFSRPGKT